VNNPAKRKELWAFQRASTQQEEEQEQLQDEYSDIGSDHGPKTRKCGKIVHHI